MHLASQVKALQKQSVLDPDDADIQKFKAMLLASHEQGCECSDPKA